MNQDNRIAIVHDFFRTWEQSMSNLRPYLTDDVVWWSRWGSLGIDNFDAVVPGVKANLAKPIKFTVHRVVAQGDLMAVEAGAKTALKSGAEYDQDYHFLFEFSGDKIKLVREHFDTKHAYEVWGSALAEYVPAIKS